MKWSALLLFLLLAYVYGCDDQKREDHLRLQTALLQKEQELNAKEKILQLKEEELMQREQKIDSASKVDSLRFQDTVHTYNPAVIGLWSVKMTCTEATCAGSAVGDTKNEQWDISYQANQLVAKAMAGDKLARVYSGFFNDGTVQLKASSDTSASQPAARINITLRITDSTAMQGEREIVRNDCRVLYTLQLEKQK